MVESPEAKPGARARIAVPHGYWQTCGQTHVCLCGGWSQDKWDSEPEYF